MNCQIISFVKRVWNKYFGSKYSGPLIRSEKYTEGVKKKLLEDLQAMKYVKVIDL